MPKYISALTEPIVIDDVWIGPGQTVTTDYYFAVLPTGVTLVSDAPLPGDPVLLDVAVTGTTTTVVPATATDHYLVTIYASNGDITVKFNSASDPITKNILSGGSYSRKCWKRSINDIRTVGSAVIRVERI